MAGTVEQAAWADSHASLSDGPADSGHGSTNRADRRAQAAQAAAELAAKDAVICKLSSCIQRLEAQLVAKDLEVQRLQAEVQAARAIWAVSRRASAGLAGMKRMLSAINSSVFHLRAQMPCGAAAAWGSSVGLRPDAFAQAKAACVPLPPRPLEHQLSAVGDHYPVDEHEGEHEAHEAAAATSELAFTDASACGALPATERAAAGLRRPTAAAAGGLEVLGDAAALLSQEPSGRAARWLEEEVLRRGAATAMAALMSEARQQQAEVWYTALLAARKQLAHEYELGKAAVAAAACTRQQGGSPPVAALAPLGTLAAVAMAAAAAVPAAVATTSALPKAGAHRAARSDTRPHTPPPAAAAHEEVADEAAVLHTAGVTAPQAGQVDEVMAVVHEHKPRAGPVHNRQAEQQPRPQLQQQAVKGGKRSRRDASSNDGIGAMQQAPAEELQQQCKRARPADAGADAAEAAAAQAAALAVCCRSTRNGRMPRVPARLLN